MKRFTEFMATGCYAGRIPIAPGTFGTGVGVLLYYLVKGLPPLPYLAFVCAFIFFAIWVSTRAQTIFGETDPQKVVIDEIAGFIVTMAFHRPEFMSIMLGFILFRIFDIAKPWPVSWAERRWSDGRGIVMDDVLAGVYANAALWILESVIPSFW